MAWTAPPLWSEDIKISLKHCRYYIAHIQKVFFIFIITTYKDPNPRLISTSPSFFSVFGLSRFFQLGDN
jgi:hypothetical protein